jgi:hypothetical protein
LITIVTDTPLLFLGAGVPGAKPKDGYDFAVVDLEVDASGAGSGTLAPAANVTLKGSAFVVEDYAVGARPARRCEKGEVNVPEFHPFVAELSTQFINLPADRINQAIRTGLCRVCAEIALDRSTLYRIDGDRRPVDEVTGSVNGGAVEGGSEAPLVRLPWS